MVQFLMASFVSVKPKLSLTLSHDSNTPEID